MKRLKPAPNLFIATLWADLLKQAGVAVTVLRANASSLAGEIPPDQAVPEVWVLDENDYQRANDLLEELTHAKHQHWRCSGCGETIDGPFEQCWSCGAFKPV